MDNEKTENSPNLTENSSSPNNETTPPKLPPKNLKINKKILLTLLITLLIIIPISVFSFVRLTNSNQQSSVENINQNQQITSEENNKTDLSYIQIVVDEDVNVSLKDSSGVVVGEQSIQDPITNPATGDTSGDPLNIFYFSEPETGDYYLELSSSTGQQFQMDIYFYDRGGNVKIENKELTGNTEFSLYFDKEDVSNSYIE